MKALKLLGIALMLGGLLGVISVAIATYEPYIAACVIGTAGYILYLFGDHFGCKRNQEGGKLNVEGGAK